MINRRRAMQVGMLGVTGGAVPAALAGGDGKFREGDRSKRMRVYVGTYTENTGSQGIYQAILNLETGALTGLELAAASVNPSFLAIHPNGKTLYAANEVTKYQGTGSGYVTAFRIQESGALKELNQQTSHGGAPCHLVVDKTGNCLLVANYVGGTVSAHKLRENGSLEEGGSVIQHEGKSVDKRRQEGPHAHSINVDPDNKYAFAADLGLDKVLIYQLQPKRGGLVPHTPASVSLPPGSGPRHFAFHPNGKTAYVINEMLSTVGVMRYRPAAGSLEVVQVISTLPEGFKGSTSTAEVQVHPSGKFVYGSNRGHDSISIFRVKGDDGTLSLVGHQPTGGKTPRNFGIDPQGKFLLAANQSSGSIQVFRIHPERGMLTPVGEPVKTPAPVCVKFLPL